MAETKKEVVDTTTKKEQPKVDNEVGKLKVKKKPKIKKFSNKQDEITKLDMSKVSTEKEEVVKVDLSKPPTPKENEEPKEETKVEDSSTDDSGVVAESESTEPTQEQEEVQPAP